LNASNWLGSARQNATSCETILSVYGRR